MARDGDTHDKMFQVYRSQHTLKSSHTGVYCNILDMSENDYPNWCTSVLYHLIKQQWQSN